MADEEYEPDYDDGDFGGDDIDVSMARNWGLQP